MIPFVYLNVYQIFFYIYNKNVFKFLAKKLNGIESPKEYCWYKGNTKYFTVCIAIILYVF